MFILAKQNRKLTKAVKFIMFSKEVFMFQSLFRVCFGFKN